MPEAMTEKMCDHMMEMLQVAILVLDAEQKILKANTRFYKAFGASPGQALGCSIYGLGGGQWDFPDLRKLIEQILPENRQCNHYEVHHEFPALGRKFLSINARRFLHDKTDAEMTLLAIEDITARKQIEDEIREMHLRDRLTQLYNRSGFLMFAEQQFITAKRTKRAMMLALIDINRMKSINDTQGQEAGDKILMDTADILRQTFRESDILGRIGGDEFAVLSIETAESAPRVIGERLKQCLDEYNRREHQHDQLSLSVGMALYNAEQPSSLADLMAQAETLLQAKKRMTQR